MAPTRILRALAALSLSVVAAAVPATAAAAAYGVPSTVSPLRAAAVATYVDDFSYSSWDAVYEIGLDDDGRARMHVTETLVARFPDFDQNHGIVRGLVTAY